MRFGYADPPYFGKAQRHYGRHHPRAGRFDRLGTHATLIRRLYRDFPDGWALSCASKDLQALLPLCPPEVRIAAWVKPWASFKPGVNPGYCWEPVIWLGGRRRDRAEPTRRDWLSCNVTLKRGLPGAKPAAFYFWLFDLFALGPGDEFADLFPGTGAGRRAWKAFCRDGPKELAR